MRTAHLRDGHQWSSALDVALKDCKRSLSRGVGRPTRAAELRLEWILEMEPTWPEVEDQSWPDCRRVVWAAAVRFLLREVEVSCVAFSPEEVKLDHVLHLVSLKLAASKMDPSAKGVARTLKCDCSDDPEDPAYWVCPFHTIQSRRLGIELESGQGREFPLIGTVGDPGRFVTKDAMIAALRHVEGIWHCG